MFRQDVDTAEENLTALEQAAGLTPGAAAFDLTGLARVLHMSVQTVRRHIRDGGLQVVAPSSKRRFVTRAAVLRFLHQPAVGA